MSHGVPLGEAAHWIDLVRRLVEEVSRSDATEFEVSQGGFRLRLRRPPGRRVPSQPSSGSEQQESCVLHVVAAPLTGVFYRSRSPSAAPYVEESDWVEPHTVVGLIETMKVFNEVTADVEGRVASMHARSGQLVYAGDPLLSVEAGQQPRGAQEAAG